MKKADPRRDPNNGKLLQVKKRNQSQIIQEMVEGHGIVLTKTGRNMLATFKSLRKGDWMYLVGLQGSRVRFMFADPGKGEEEAEEITTWFQQRNMQPLE